MQNLLFGLAYSDGFFAVHGDGGFGAHDGANAAAGTAFSFQGSGVISLGCDVIVSKRQHFLGTRGNTYLAALAVQLVDFDSSLYGHSYLLESFFLHEPFHYHRNQPNCEVSDLTTGCNLHPVCHQVSL
jgi:hypothetical protein